MSQQLNLAIFCHFLSSERSFCLGCHDRHGSSGVARWTCSWGPTLVLGPQKRGGRQKVPSKSTGTHKEICNLLDSITLQLTVRPCEIGLGRCVSTKNCFFLCRVWVYVNLPEGRPIDTGEAPANLWSHSALLQYKSVVHRNTQSRNDVVNPMVIIITIGRRRRKKKEEEEE